MFFKCGWDVDMWGALSSEQRVAAGLGTSVTAPEQGTWRKDTDLGWRVVRSAGFRGPSPWQRSSVTD